MSTSVPQPLDTKRRTEAQEYFRTLQVDITTELESIDGKNKFSEDPWSYDAASPGPVRTGGGLTKVLENGAVFEKAGVNFSAVESALTEKLAARMSVNPQKVFATGISLVLHPFSPMVPSVHMNLRYLELESGDAWFGGGIDLTPFYIRAEDIKKYHTALKRVCDAYNPDWYMRFKNSCDQYFYLSHRNETRGVGGLFFDYERENPDLMFRFVQELGRNFIPIYKPIVERRRHEVWGRKEKVWQEIRRGRYAEFNLLYDRGTLFGLETEGRTESILISLPPHVRWGYDYQPEPGTREYDLLEVLHHPRSWL